MTPNERYQLAKSLFEKGYNCSQSVVLAFKDLLEINTDTLLKLSSSFGGGIARLRETCGAVSGIAIVLGILYGYSTPEEGDIKAIHYSRVQEVIKKFETKYSSIKCGVLLGIEGHSTPTPTPRTKEFYKSRPCGDFIGFAAQIIQEYIDENPIK